MYDLYGTIYDQSKIILVGKHGVYVTLENQKELNYMTFPHFKRVAGVSWVCELGVQE